MKTRSFVPAIVISLAAAGFPCFPFQALSLEITNASRNTYGQVVFNVVAGVGTTNTIEASQTTETWFPLVSGTATNGVLPFVHPGSASYDQLFYRARSGPEIPAEAVSYSMDTNLTVFALLTPEAGGRCQIFTPDGPLFTFSASSNLVAEPTVVSMTLVTNVTPAPSSNAPVAVLLEPAGLEFSGVAQLEILYPTNLTPAFNAGYTFGSDGKEFHLVPSMATSNRVVIHVRHFSGYGTAPISPQTIGALSRQTLVNAAQTLERNIATRLGESQLRRSRGDNTQDYRLFTDLYNILEEYYETQLKPALDRAATDCDVAPQAMIAAAAYCGYYQDTYSTGGLDPVLFEIPLAPERQNEIETKVCAAISHCDSELDTLCATGDYNLPALVPRARWYEYARRFWGCPGGGGNLSDRFRNCASEWYGTVSFRQEGSSTNSLPLEGYSEWGDLLRDWTGLVTNATVSIIDSNNFMLNAALPLHTYVYEHSTTVRHYPRDCPSRAGEEYIQDKTYLGSGPQDGLLSVAVMGGKVLFLQVTGDPNGVQFIPQQGQEWDHKRTLGCNGQETLQSKLTRIDGFDWPANAFGGEDCLRYDGKTMFGTCTSTDAETVGDVQVNAITTVTVDLRRK